MARALTEVAPAGAAAFLSEVLVIEPIASDISSRKGIPSPRWDQTRDAVIRPNGAATNRLWIIDWSTSRNFI